MNSMTTSFLTATLLGLGVTLTLDLWTLLLKYTFQIPPSNLCLVGRWLRYMPEGTFKHPSLASSPAKAAECTVGWLAHYMIGITFAIAFIALAGNRWLQHPSLIPAMIFGIVTVSAPFFIMQPSFGLGLAASKTSNPLQARLRSLMNHFVFGIGLYLFGFLANWLLSLNK
jgi:hypothetical protein